jgi:hypothetical protein
MQSCPSAAALLTGALVAIAGPTGSRAAVAEPSGPALGGTLGGSAAAATVAGAPLSVHGAPDAGSPVPTELWLLGAGLAALVYLSARSSVADRS